MIKTITKFAMTAGLFAIAMAATPASAALVPASPACNDFSTLTAISPNPAACLGSFVGNDIGQEADVIQGMMTGFVGDTGLGTWSFEESVNGLSSGSIISSVGGSAGGTIAFTSPLAGMFSLVLQAGTQFSVYLFDATVADIPSVQYTTAGVFANARGRVVDLRHVSLYSFEADGPDPNTVPVPASGVMLGLGLAGAAIIAKRRGKRNA